MEDRIRKVLGLLLVLLSAFCAGGVSRASDLALVGGKVYPAPAEPPLEDATVLVRDGRIQAVGPSATTRIPGGATVIDCKGLVVTAGFWNSHVHILTPELLHADTLTPEQLTSRLQKMLMRWGFTSVFDLGSVLNNTTLIRRRIESGETKGPRILTVGEPFWTKGGTPSYAKGFLEANHISIPDVESSAQGVERVRQQIRDGADGIKIFAGSIEDASVLLMPEEVARAIVAEAHRAGRPAFAHPTNDRGTEIAVQSGVDIVAHTTPSGELWSPSFVERLKASHVALIPTLTLWDVEGKRGGGPTGDIQPWIDRAIQQLRAYSASGGQVLFGTDVGYIDECDTSEEFTLMARAGMSFRQILASLTTAPAERFGYSRHSGRVVKGSDGDLVVLGADPAQDVTSFAKVRYTVRGGKVIYSER